MNDKSPVKEAIGLIKDFATLSAKNVDLARQQLEPIAALYARASLQSDRDQIDAAITKAQLNCKDQDKQLPLFQQLVDRLGQIATASPATTLPSERISASPVGKAANISSSSTSAKQAPAAASVSGDANYGQLPGATSRDKPKASVAVQQSSQYASMPTAQSSAPQRTSTDTSSRAQPQGDQSIYSAVPRRGPATQSEYAAFPHGASSARTAESASNDKSPATAVTDNTDTPGKAPKRNIFKILVQKVAAFREKRKSDHEPSTTKKPSGSDH